MSNGRFEYIVYDEEAQSTSADCKALCEGLETVIELKLLPSREKALAMTKLEECFMWIGKAIRADQRNREKLVKTRWDGEANLEDKRNEIRGKE